MKLKANILLSVVCLLAGLELHAQTQYYFVAFADKEGNGYSLQAPEAFLSQQAITRRASQNITLIEQDLPVTASYVNQLALMGAKVFETSKWFNGVIIKSTQLLAEQLKQLSFVSDVVYLAPQNYAGRRAQKQDLTDTSQAPTDSLFQNKILGADAMHEQGFFGQGVRVAVFDGGFRKVNSIAAFAKLYNDNRVVYTYDFVSKSSDVYQYSDHGTKVLSLMAADLTYSYQGIAPGAEYMLMVTENVPSEYRIEEYYWLIAAERADSAGVDIISSSLGYNTFDDPAMNYLPEDMDGSTTIVTRAAQIASEKGMVVVNSAGNSGNTAWQIITAPADMHQGLAVGSIQANYAVSSFSSRGPTADNRIKPDVVALGSQAYLLSEQGTVTVGSGTSFSCPQVAALMAGVWQAYPELPALQLVEATRVTASNAALPDNDMGYGIPGFEAIKNYIEAINGIESVQVYPNPVTNKSALNIKFVNPAKTNQADVKLYDATGKLIVARNYAITWGQNQATLNLSSLTKGIYFLKIVFNDNSQTKPVAVRILKM